MLFSKMKSTLKHINFISLSVPAMAIIANLFLPLRPIVQQGLIGVTLIWFYIELMNGFQLWH